MLIHCTQGDGKGYHSAMLKNLSTLNYEKHIVPCEQVGCHNGMVDTDEFYRQVGFLPEEKS